LRFCYPLSARSRHLAAYFVLLSVRSPERLERRRNSVKLIGQPIPFLFQQPDNITYGRH
jgi:hypothetical protein